MKYHATAGLSGGARAALLFLTLLASGLFGCGGGGGGSTPTSPVPPEITPTPPAPPPVTGAVTLRRAAFRDVGGHHARGDAAIVMENGAFRLELAANFQTDSGSVVDLRLCRRSDRCTASDLDLGPIQARRGAQTYSLPDAAAQYPFVVVWCRPFQVPFGFGELR